jgi:DNA modification methylase
MVERFLGDRIALYVGDCIDVLAQLDENSLDACCCDPPYHLVSVYKRFANEARTESTVGNGAYGRHARGFMGKVWDGGDIAFDPETWRAVFRVLKPGAHLLACGGTRTYHRMACAIEDAGFEIRDCIQWLYGSGFPKSHDVSKGIDRAAGVEREIIRERYTARRIKPGATVVREGAYGKQDITFTAVDSAPATDAARQWEGWHTALKPACEMIVLARKPLSEGTVAANVLKWGTGAINVDGCRVAGNAQPFGNGTARSAGIMGNSTPRGAWESDKLGRWPANVIHDGSEEIVAAFPESISVGGDGYKESMWCGGKPTGGHGLGDSGSAARYFYTAKADSDDRLGSKHPTIKPLDLMQYLVRLITPPKGICLDPFAGTGTLGEAAWREGMSAVLIEREAEYCADIRRRMALALSGPDERARESIKAKNLPRDDGPLFAPRPTEIGCARWPGCGCGTQSGPHTCEGREAAE